MAIVAIAVGSVSVSTGALFEYFYFIRMKSLCGFGAILGVVMWLVSMAVGRSSGKVVVLEADHPACANCGYDLYDNASGKCPECGAESS